MRKTLTYEAFGLKGRKAGGMLGVLVRPENPVAVALSDPVLVHPGKKIRLAVRRKPLVNGLALIRRHGGATGGACGGVGRRLRVILTVQVAVLSI